MSNGVAPNCLTTAWVAPAPGRRDWPHHPDHNHRAGNRCMITQKEKKPAA